MTLLGLIVALLIAAVFLWGVDRLPLDGTIKQIIKVLVVVIAAVFVILFLAALFGYRGGADLLHLR